MYHYNYIEYLLFNLNFCKVEENPMIGFNQTKAIH